MQQALVNACAAAHRLRRPAGRGADLRRADAGAAARDRAAGGGRGRLRRGWSGPRREAIVREADRLLADAAAADAMRKVANPFGDGQASRRIAQAVFARLAVPARPPKRPRPETAGARRCSPPFARLAPCAAACLRGAVARAGRHAAAAAARLAPGAARTRHERARAQAPRARAPPQVPPQQGLHARRQRPRPRERGGAPMRAAAPGAGIRRRAARAGRPRAGGRARRRAGGAAPARRARRPTGAPAPISTDNDKK